MIRTLHEGLLADGIKVSITKLCAWFGVPRRTVYYRPTKSAPKVDPRFAEPIKAMIEEEPSFGYRTVAWLLGFNKNTVQRIFRIKGWQVRKRAIGMRPRIQAVPSVAAAPNERWSTDLARVWTGKDGWAALALVIDCHTRELLGWHISRSGKATTASAALELGLTTRRYQSGEVDYDGHISRRGDRHLRSLLYEAAVVMLTRSRVRNDSVLRKWGLELKERIGLKRAAVAVARKLAVIMHSMLKTGEAFRPSGEPATI